MKLYSGPSSEFITYTQQKQIVQRMLHAFRDYYRAEPQPNEIRSWENSLMEISEIFNDAELLDHGVILEYQLPLTSKRLDCLICGHDKYNIPNAIIIELKQWSKSFTTYGQNEVCTYLNGELRDILHPSSQVAAYKEYLTGSHTAFSNDVHPIYLYACSFLHNYKLEENDPILDPKFDNIIDEYPIFSSEQKGELKKYLKNKLGNGEGNKCLDRIIKGTYSPSKKLMENIRNVIQTQNEYILLDEQKIVFDKVLSLLENAQESQQKSAIIVKGGPGTGKSVIAMNLLGHMLKKGLKVNYVTGSKSFNETLWEKLGKPSKVFIKYFNSYMRSELNIMDCLICDEAHRIREKSQSYTFVKSSVPQLYEILKAAKVSVFFIDDNQIVKPGEIGSFDYIKEYARSKNVTILEFELDAQFRCKGSEGFINWINNTFGIKRTANIIWDESSKEYDFKIFSTPWDLEEAIMEKHHQGFNARIAAGFCWKWSNPVKNALVNDIQIGNYQRPWNAKPNAARAIKDIPPASLWATDPKGIGQIGCVYTAQGFEYDYAGIIVGKDLVYRFQSQKWIGQKEYSMDPGMKNISDLEFLGFVKNTYRVLFTRGMLGCYVYFEDKETEDFFKSRMDNLI